MSGSEIQNFLPELFKSSGHLLSKVIGSYKSLGVNKGVIICHVDPGRAIVWIEGWNNNEDSAAITVARIAKSAWLEVLMVCEQVTVVMK